MMFRRSRRPTEGTAKSSDAHGTTNQIDNKSWRDGGTAKSSDAHGTTNQIDNKSWRDGASKHGRYNRGCKLGLKEILDNEDVEMILEKLLDDKSGFRETLKDNELNGEFIVLIIQLMVKVTKTTFISSKMKIFNIVFVDSTYADQLRKFILDLPDHLEADKKTNSYFWNNANKFWDNLIDIFDDIIKMPTLATQVLPNLLSSIIRIIPALENEHLIVVSERITQKFKMLHSAVRNLRTIVEKKYKPQQRNVMSNEDKILPPNDFRTISVYPKTFEVTCREEPFIRKNKIKGPYVDVEHYLDVQFRLLREDFIATLRNGICQYMEKPNQKSYDDIKIHHNVYFLNNVLENEMKCFRIKFDFRRTSKTSDQFMHGSLVCFTRDNFSNLIFGKVITSPRAAGTLIVGFNDDVNISYGQAYIMVESTAFFEPYYHVLTALQNIDSNNFPLESYIIYADTTNDIPIHDNSLLDIPRRQKASAAAITRRLTLLQIAPAPREQKCYSLNESQQKAFAASLTRQLTVIQGPPGTGKTFLGLKIAQALLENNGSFNNRPMLVVCFTNHALDQFLEGISEITNSLVRVGDQSKNVNMEMFNLRNIKIKLRNESFRKKRVDSDSQYVSSLKHGLRLYLKELNQIDSKMALLQQSNGILNFSFFYDVCANLRDHWIFNIDRKEIKNWLMEHAKAKPIEVYRRCFDEVDTSGSSYDSYSDELDNYLDEDNDDMLCVEPGYILSLQTLSSKIRITESKLMDPNLEHELSNNKEKLCHQLREYDYLEQKLDEFAHSQGEYIYGHPQNMTENERWNLYKFFCNEIAFNLSQQRISIERQYQDTYNLYSDAKSRVDLRIMRQHLVVGMTTSCAARLRTSLKALQSPIVIVEEAAEILESHIVTAITSSCRQLILLGDHQQLRPTAASYRVENEYKMGVSLFERLVNNNIQCFSLNVQHRMRPNICNLIRPAIYADLKDHESVENRPGILGVEKSIFFISHNNEETAFGYKSKKNVHEAKFLINLARYLILTGYMPENITILAAYLGQMFEMQKELDKYVILKTVRIAVLDNYQGEESDIILLSLVRNNKENRNGFLKIENRVCVALSRARNGLYIMGNMDQLCNDKETVWHKVKERLIEEDALGTHLELRCQNHNKVTEVVSIADFSKVPKGGCDVPCNAKLTCGHNCKSVCHIRDKDHLVYKCSVVCQRILKCQHEVQLECHEDVTEYKCKTPVNAVLSCGHMVVKPCYYQIEKFPCSVPCNSKVEPCGHTCKLTCHLKGDASTQCKCQESCTKIRNMCSTQTHMCRRFCNEECELCLVLVQKKKTRCSHFVMVPCSEDMNSMRFELCLQRCGKKLKCGHECEKKCSEICGPCEKKVIKSIPKCGHEISMKCHVIPKHENCNKKCEIALPCGHKYFKKCGEPCITRCEKMKTCNLRSPCGHVVKEIKCYENVSSADKLLLKYCTEPCDTVLRCGHKCRGKCSQCFQGRIHMPCMEKNKKRLICYHSYSMPCGKVCRCILRCGYSCIHSNCSGKCGEKCSQCRKPCPRICKHQVCENKCGEICSVKPCKMPCPMKLQCGHDCVGFCSEPCPRLCSICNKVELTKAGFGTEEHKDARFVELQDCKHVFESNELEIWLTSCEIEAKICPKCDTPIIKTRRYSDFVKNALSDINKVNIELYGTTKRNGVLELRLLQRIVIIKEHRLIKSGIISKHIITGLEIQFHRYRVMLKSLEWKIQILEHILDICVPLPSPISEDIVTQITMILTCLIRDDEDMTVQEIDDIQMEICRLKRMVEIFQIKLSFSDLELEITLPHIEQQIVTFKQYSEEIDEEIMTKLKKIECGIEISEIKKIDIFRTEGLAQGWYMCPNGHLQVLSESTCNECGENIAGKCPTLSPTNLDESEE